MNKRSPKSHFKKRLFIQYWFVFQECKLACKMFDKDPSALVLPLLVIFPLSLHVGVRFEFRVGFHLRDAEAVEDRVHLVHQNGVDALALVFRPYGHQIQVGPVVFLECIQ